MARLLILVLLALPLATAAQIYKSVDQNGNTVYSDTPPTDGTQAEKIRLGTTNSSPPPPHVDRPEPSVSKRPEKVETRVEIVAPATDTTIPIGHAGTFTVEAAVTPALGNGMSAQLLLDDSPVAGAQPATSWVLTNTNPGTHTLRVIVLDSTGKTVASSAPVTVHVLRTIIRPGG